MNKAFILIIILSIVFIGTLPAQGNLVFGIKGGLNTSNIIGEHYDYEGQTDYITGFCAGAFFSYYFNDIFAIQPEILFTTKGMKFKYTYYTYTGIGVEVEKKKNLNYIEIPILAKYYIETQGIVKPHMYIGPYLGLKYSAKYSLKGEEYSENVSAQVSGEGKLDDINGIDLGIVIGGGFDLIPQGKLGIDVRYTVGLTKIRDYEGTSEKNSVISLMLGYSFR